MLVVNAPQFAERAEILWEKGTNRAAFSRKEVDHYNWIDIGSSFLPSEITAAFLFAQLENLDRIQERRKEIWWKYQEAFFSTHRKGGISDQKFSLERENIYKTISDSLPEGTKVREGGIPLYATNNAHMFYLVFEEAVARAAYIQNIGNQGILVISHYLPLHLSPFYKHKYKKKCFPQAEHYAGCLLRLPLYYELGNGDQV